MAAASCAVAWACASLLLGVVACTPASAQKPTTLRDGAVAASRVEAILEKRPVRLVGMQVRGTLQLPEGALLAAEKVDFRGDVLGPEACEVCPPRRSRKATFAASDSTFHGLVDFYGGPEFEALDWQRCNFKDFVYLFGLTANSVALLRSEFEDDVVLAAARVGYINVADTAFRRELDLSGMEFEADFNTTRIRASRPIRVSWAELGDEWARGRIDWGRHGKERVGQVEAEFRFWMRNFNQLGDRPAELKARYFLIELKRDLRFRPTDRDWWAAFLLKAPSAYGTEPFRPLVTAALIVLVFALIFGLANPFRSGDDPTSRPSGADRVLFACGYSLDLFVPVIKVSGVSEWGWKLSNSHWRWVAALERVLGVLLTGAAAYSVGTYVT